MTPYALISDTHHHNWTAFSSVNSDGVNTRLQQILDETQRCAVELAKVGGNTIIHAGDLFHVRGSVAPSVLNPTLDMYRRLCKDFRVVLLAGNHDLEGKDANDLGSAITALKEVGCIVANAEFMDANVTAVPWTPGVADLKARIEAIDKSYRHGRDLVLHAGIDGVIKGLPPHGLDAEYLSKLGFRRVFAGHYHHHKQLADNVWSIGALTHQTWGDIGTKAGFLIVTGEGVKWHSSHAPSFVEITPDMEPEDIPLLVDGNYVRAKVKTSKPSEIDAMRKLLHDSGARGVTIVSQPAVGVTRTASSIKAGSSLEVSVQDFVNAAEFENPAKLATLCGEILKEAREAL